MTTQQIISLALQRSMPVLFGYLPLGAAFGLLFSELDYHWSIATLMGLLIYAGAGQFLAVGLLAAGAGLLEVAVATLMLNSRHIFYGLSLLKRFQGSGWRKPYLIFGLTDETYSLLTSTPGLPEFGADIRLATWITALNHGYWVAGCTLGALLGHFLPFDTSGMEFTLTALFIVLLIEQYKSVKEAAPFLIALAAGLGALLLVGPQQMLLVSILTTTCLLILQYKRRAQWITQSI